jgi:transposase-like protein
MQKTKKKRCWGCDSLDVICWGKQNNKQRFKCKSCGLMFTRNSPDQTKRNRFVWFREWIVGKQTFHQLVSIL